MFSVFHVRFTGAAVAAAVAAATAAAAAIAMFVPRQKCTFVDVVDFFFHFSFAFCVQPTHT